MATSQPNGDGTAVPHSRPPETATVRLTATQATHVAHRLLADVPELIRGGMNNPPTRNCIHEVRSMLDRKEAWLNELEQVDGEGMVTWTAPKPEVVAVAVDLLAMGLDDVVVTDILEDGGGALEHLASRTWLSMAETALAIRDQAAAQESVS